MNNQTKPCGKGHASASENAPGKKRTEKKMRLVVNQRPIVKLGKNFTGRKKAA